MSIKVGVHAPDFELNDEHGQLVRLADLRGQWVILCWYMSAAEARDIRDCWGQISGEAVLFDISSGSMTSRRAFRRRHALVFPLLTDAGNRVARRYGVCRREYSGPTMSSVPGKYERGSSWHLVFDRETFVIAPDGTVARKFSKYFNVVGADGKSRPFYEVMTAGKRRRTLHPAKATWHALEILTALGELKAT